MQTERDRTWGERMNAPPDRPLSELPASPGSRPPQFTVRAALLFITACCVLFAALAAAPGRFKISVIVLSVLVPMLAYAASEIPHGLAWLVGGAAVGLAGSLLLGAGLVAHAYNPSEKEAARWSASVILYCGPIVGDLFGLAVACIRKTKQVVIAMTIGGTVPLIAVVAYLCTTRASFSSGPILMGLGVSIAMGASLGAGLASDLSDEVPRSLYVAVFVSLAALLGSCCLWGPPFVYR